MLFYVCNGRYFEEKKNGIEEQSCLLQHFCPYLPSMSVVQLLIVEISCFLSTFLNSAEFDTSHPTSTAVLYCTVLEHVHVTFVIHAALPLTPEPVYPHVFARTSRTSSCLLASKIGKRQNGMFSDLAPRPSRTQLPCASNKLHKHRSTIGRRDNSVITSTREKSWGVTHGVNTVPTI